MSDQSFGPWLSGTKRALGLLASTADIQAQYLSDLGAPGVVDELALELDAMLTPLKSILSARAAERALSKLRDVEEALDDPDLEWTLQSLELSMKWESLRQLAFDALRELQVLAD